MEFVPSILLSFLLFYPRNSTSFLQSVGRPLPNFDGLHNPLLMSSFVILPPVSPEPHDVRPSALCWLPKTHSELKMSKFSRLLFLIAYLKIFLQSTSVSFEPSRSSNSSNSTFELSFSFRYCFILAMTDLPRAGHLYPPSCSIGLDGFRRIWGEGSGKRKEGRRDNFGLIQVGLRGPIREGEGFLRRGGRKKRGNRRGEGKEGGDSERNQGDRMILGAGGTCEDSGDLEGFGRREEEGTGGFGFFSSFFFWVLGGGRRGQLTNLGRERHSVIFEQLEDGRLGSDRLKQIRLRPL